MDEATKVLNLIAKVKDGGVRMTDFADTEIGRKNICHQVLNAITQMALASKLADSTYQQLPFAVAPTELSIVDRFLVGTKYRPSNDHSVFEASMVCRAATLFMSVNKLGGNVIIFSSLTGLAGLFPGSTFDPIRDIVALNDNHFNRTMTVKYGLGKGAVVPLSVGYFDGFRSFSLSDVISMLFRLSGQRRKILFGVPYSYSLFVAVRESTVNGSIDYDEELASGYLVSIRQRMIYIRSKRGSQNYTMSTDAYFELFTRAYVATDRAMDVQVEIDSHYPGVAVLKIQEVLKQYRHVAETSVRTFDMLPGCEKHVRVVCGYKYEAGQFVRTKYFVAEEDFEAVFRTGMGSDKLDYSSMSVYANARFETFIEVGLVVRPGKIYSPEVITALIQSAYIDCFVKRYDMAKVLALLPKSDWSLLDRLKAAGTTAIAIIAAVALAHGFSALPVSVLSGALYLAKPALAMALAAKGIDKIIAASSILLLKLVKQQAIPMSYLANVTETYSSFIGSYLPKPLVPCVLTSNCGFKQEPLFHDKSAVYRVKSGELFVRVDDGDIFDVDGHQYVYADKGLRPDTVFSVILFSKTEKSGLHQNLGDLFASEKTEVYLSGYVILHASDEIAYRRVYGSRNKGERWINGGHPEVGNVYKAHDLVNERFYPVTVISQDLDLEIAEVTSDVLILWGILPESTPGGMIAPEWLDNASILALLKARYGIEAWHYSGYYTKDGISIQESDAMKRRFRWEPKLNQVEEELVSMGTEFVYDWLGMKTSEPTVNSEVLVEWLCSRKLHTKYQFNVRFINGKFFTDVAEG